MPAPLLAVFGRNRATAEELDAARSLGTAIADAGAVLLTGGVGSGALEIKEQAVEGVIAASGPWVGVENSDALAAPRRVRGGLVVSPGVGHRRNFVGAALCDAAIALPGEDGTASELVFALALGRPVVVYGWTPAGDLLTAAQRRVPRTDGTGVLDRAIAAAYDRPAVLPAPTPLDVPAAEVVRSSLDRAYRPVAMSRLLGLTNPRAWEALLAERAAG